MALPEKPDKCFCCGSDRIIREGWRLRCRDESEENQNLKAKE